jgi:hypothetical protein
VNARAVLSTAVDWLIEPAAPERQAPPPASEVVVESLVERPCVAVVGLRPRVGATVVARALAAELATRDPSGAAAVTSAGGPGGGVPLGLPGAARLARTLAPVSGGTARACGRVCLVPVAEPVRLADAARYLAPLVLDVGDPQEAPAAAATAGAVVLVGGPRVEPALAALVAESLARVGPEPVIACNPSREDGERWSALGAIDLSDSRVGARLALAGREPRGELGRAIQALADACAGRPVTVPS